VRRVALGRMLVSLLFSLDAAAASACAAMRVMRVFLATVAAPPSQLSPVPAPRSFRNRATEYVRESGIQWVSGSTRRQCDRARAARRLNTMRLEIIGPLFESLDGKRQSFVGGRFGLYDRGQGSGTPESCPRAARCQP
jgi:hypothetical protein